MLDFFNGQNDVGKTFPTRENAIWLTLSITSMFFQSSWTILDMWYDSSPMNIRVANWPKLDQNTKKHTQTVKAKFFLIQKKNSINRGFPGFTVSLHNFLHRRCFFSPRGIWGNLWHEIPSNLPGVESTFGASGSYSCGCQGIPRNLPGLVDRWFNYSSYSIWTIYYK